MESEFKASHVVDVLFEKDIDLKNISSNGDCSNDYDSGYGPCLNPVNNRGNSRHINEKITIAESAIEKMFGD